MFAIPFSLGLGLTVAAAILVSCRGSEASNEADLSTSVHDFTLSANDGSDYPLAQHAGSVILIVNTASRCGFTKQYEGLQQLHTDYVNQGLVVIGIPSNNFMGQEPGSDEEILEFCQVNFGVTFPLMARSVVKGDEMIPLYRYLTESSHFPGRITWNFNKFLVGHNGHVVAREGSRTSPEDLRPAIEAALAAATAARESAGEESAGNTAAEETP